MNEDPLDLTSFPHQRDRASPPSWTWITGAGWPHPTPLLLTVRARLQDWDGPSPAPVLFVFATLLDRIETGFQPRAGAVVELAGPGFPHALMLVPAAPVPGVPALPDALAIVGLHAAEVAAFAHVGKGRLLAHLARHDDARGFSRISDWRRPALADRCGLGSTALAGLHRVPAPDWSCVSRGSGLTLRVRGRGDGGAELAALTPGAAVCFLVDPAWDEAPLPPWPPPPLDPERPGVVGAWGQAGDRGAGGPEAHSPAFLVVGCTAGEEGLGHLEDGLRLDLRTDTLGRLVHALERSERLELTLQDRTLLRLRPVHGKSAPAAKDLPCPERAPVPMPSPTFAAAESWQTFSTPFLRVRRGPR